MSKIIDAKGKQCPMPVIMAKKEIDGGEQSFTVIVDNSTAVENLSRLAKSRGFSVQKEEKEGVFSLAFEKTGEADTSVGGGMYCVFIGKDRVGEGSDDLGLSLMQMFLYTLTQSDDLPESVLMMNGGVKLACMDEQCVGHLKELEAKGVEVLVCGTCLNFFEIAKELKAGTVSNMYSIVEKMQKADKVISF